MAAVGHLGEAPHRHAAPALLGREEAPVGHRLTKDRVSDVVGAQSERVHGEQRLAALGLGRGLLAKAAAVQIVLGDEEVHGSPHAIPARARERASREP